MTITQESINDLIYTDYFEKILDNLLGLVGRRPRSEKEITQHAKEYFYKKFGKDIDQKIFDNSLAQVLEKLKNYDQFNDRDFAAWWLEQRQKSNKSTRQIRQELFQKGVSQDLIEELLDQDGGDEVTKARTLAERKLPSYKNLEPFKKKEKLSRYLASKGFDWETIKEAINKLSSSD